MVTATTTVLLKLCKWRCNKLMLRSDIIVIDRKTLLSIQVNTNSALLYTVATTGAVICNWHL